MTHTCRVENQYGPKWSDVPALTLGPAPPSLPTPDEFVLIEEGGAPVLRLDLYHDPNDYHLITKALRWHQWIVVGCCASAYLVPLSGGDVLDLDISATDDAIRYFSDFWCGDEFLLIIGASGLVRVEPNGQVLWRNHELGLDGVTIKSVGQDSIEGEGEWDPPGGWKPFSIDCQTGRDIQG